MVRLASTVHNVGDKGMKPRLLNLAPQKGFVTYIGDASARWPAVHRFDAVILFRLALEKDVAGASYNGVAEQSVRIKDFMTVIGKQLKLPLEGSPLNEAGGTKN